MFRRQVGRADLASARQPVPRGGQHHLVPEQGEIPQPRVGLLRVHDAEVDAGVQQRGDRVPGRIGDDLHVDVRVSSAKGRQHRREPVVAGVALGAEPDHGRAAGRLAPERLLRLDQLGYDPSGGLEQPLAGRGRHHPLAQAVEQREAEPALQLQQLVAQGRLGEVQVPGRLGERAMLRDGQDQLQVPNLEDHRSLRPPNAGQRPPAGQRIVYVGSMQSRSWRLVRLAFDRGGGRPTFDPSPSGASHQPAAVAFPAYDFYTTEQLLEAYRAGPERLRAASAGLSMEMGRAPGRGSGRSWRSCCT